MARVLMIALDAMELDLVKSWSEDGTLPNLAQLRETCASAELRSSAEWFVASPWPTFYTSTTPADHGIYHYLLWDPEQMKSRRPGPDQPIAEPFWRDLARRGLNTLVIDAPMVYPPPDESTPGIEICGWNTHDLLADPWVHPASLRSRLESRDFRPLSLSEVYRPMTLAELDTAHKNANAATQMLCDISLDLLATEPWDFALVCLTAPHQSGHQFFSDTGLAEPPTGASPTEAALRDIYASCDDAVGRLIAAVPDDTTVLVTALHGMCPNSNRGELLPDMLRLILDGPKQTSALQTLRKLIPQPVRQAIKARLPRSLQDRLTGYWRTSGLDWSTTRAFAFLPDLQGYVRVNLAGREARGIVLPGAEYDALCAQIIDGIAQFTDADTGAPIIQQAVRMDVLFPDHPGLVRLPDIAINWAHTPCAAHRQLTSPFGTIDWPTPGRNLDGRSGNHRGRGFLIVHNGPAGGATELPTADIMDLAPTVYEILGVPPPAHAQGQPIWFREG